MASITLTGGAVELTIGGSYVEPGYSAADDIAGDVTADVVVTGTVGTKVGSYTLTYTLPVDTNVATQVVQTRTVTIVGATKVIDTTFDIGNEARTGESTVGTAYDILVDKINGGTFDDKDLAKAACMSDETALDPYEVKWSK